MAGKGVADKSAVDVMGAETHEFPLTLDEFCARLSSRDGRVEMIGGFFASEKTAGRVNDLEAAFMKRYLDFAGRAA